MSYSTSAPPLCVQTGINGSPSQWYYVSTDVHTDVDASGYFTNGAALGMRVGDVMDVAKSDATIGVTRHYVTAVTAGGAATIAPATLA